MSNAAIAESLGCSVATVHKYIGSQTGRRRERSAKVEPLPAAMAPAAVLKITSRVVNLEGEAADYTLDTKSGVVLFQIRGGDGCVASVSFEQFEAFSLEIQDIRRRLELDGLLNGGEGV